MKPGLILGFSLILVSAVASGVFGVALRKRRVFSGELMWLIVFLTGYLLLPHAIVMLALLGWEAALGRACLAGLAPGILFGLGWGVASLLFAHGIAMLGVSLGYAIIGSWLVNKVDRELVSLYYLLYVCTVNSTSRRKDNEWRRHQPT